MIKSHYWILLLMIFSSHSTTDGAVIREKPKPSSYSIRSVFTNKISTVLPDYQFYQDHQDQSISNLHTTDAKNEHSGTTGDSVTSNILSRLPRAPLEEIFEYLLVDPSSIRLTCRQFCRLFDSMSHRMAWMNFPDCHKKTFSQWDSKPQRFKMIRLAELGLVVSGLYKMDMRSLKPLRSLREQSFLWISHLRSKSEPASLLAISMLLKLEIIDINDIRALNLMNTRVLVEAWKLGLLSIAKAVARDHEYFFHTTIGHSCCGLALAIENQRHHLARFMVETAESFETNHVYERDNYFSRIVYGLIDAKYWVLLCFVQSAKIGFDYRPHLRHPAQTGCVAGLEVLKNQAIFQPCNLPHVAATYGHVDVLEKLHEFGILIESAGADDIGETAVHCAAFSGATGCLVYLLNRLPGQPLDMRDELGMMPIHSAALGGSTEALLEIIERYPRYHPSGIRNWFKEVLSPLNVAVCCCQFEAARILLDAFPGLINYRDPDGDTALHLAIGKANDKILILLLQNSSPRAIKARNRLGNTALHLACINGQLRKIKVLLDTGCFTGTELNNEKATPISLISRKLPEIDLAELMSRHWFSVDDKTSLFA